MKTHVLIVSRYFPKTHPKNGQETRFIENILELLKIHTIRGNYDLWEKRIKEVQEGKAVLSVRYWSDKPYRSKQVEVCQFNQNSNVGIQELHYVKREDLHNQEPIIHGIYEDKIMILNNFGIHEMFTVELVAKNDGLNETDFKNWFKDVHTLDTMAIIQFTDYRY